MAKDFFFARIVFPSKNCPSPFSPGNQIYNVHPFYCLVSNREGLGTSLQIMGLATIDSHSLKEHNEIHKIPLFGVNQASFH